MWPRVGKLGHCPTVADVSTHLSAVPEASASSQYLRYLAAVASHPLGITRFLSAGIYKAIATEMADSG